jgi:hypothetical protein
VAWRPSLPCYFAVQQSRFSNSTQLLVSQLLAHFVRLCYDCRALVWTSCRQFALLIIGVETPWLKWLSVFELNVFGATGGAHLCVMPLSPMEQLMLGIEAPISCVFLLLVTYLLHKAAVRCASGRQFSCWTPSTTLDNSRYTRSAIGLILYSCKSCLTPCGVDFSFSFSYAVLLLAQIIRWPVQL